VYEQIAANKRKTVVLIAAAILLLGAVGYVIGLLYASGPVGLVGAVCELDTARAAVEASAHHARRHLDVPMVKDGYQSGLNHGCQDGQSAESGHLTTSL